MAEFTQKELTGSLWRNDRKENEKQPEFKGSAKIDGIDYWLSAWVKETKAGVKFFSLSFKAKGEGAEIEVKAKKQVDSDNIPF